VPHQPDSDDPKPATPVEDARQALREIERKRVDLEFSGDRKRTRRFHRAFLTGLLLVNGGLVLGMSPNGHSGDWTWPQFLLFLIAAGIPIGCFVGFLLASAVGTLADLASDFVDLWCWITGRERKQPDLDRLARRIHERPPVAGPPLPDPETAITPAGGESSPAILPGTGPPTPGGDPDPPPQSAVADAPAR
jgi:hypothetical protein